jgi:hypothetical protein
MDPYSFIEKSAAFNFAPVKQLFRALHSGARAGLAEGNIAHAQKMIGKYGNDPGMQWRVDKAQKALSKYQGRQTRLNNEFDNYVQGLTPGQQTAARIGRKALTLAYDSPRMFAYSPNQTMGMAGSIGASLGLGAIGINADPFSRAGQLHGYTNAKDVASQAAQQGGMQSAQDMLQGFDSLSFKDRLKLARNPNMISSAVDPSYMKPGTGIDYSSLILGNPDALDGVIRSEVQKGVNNFQM